MNKLLVGLLLVSGCSWGQNVSTVADNTATYAVDKYSQPLIESLAKMVSYKTVAVKGLALADNPQFSGYKQYVKSLSQSFGLEYTDHGHVLIITLGADPADKQRKRVGIITHGDVQPADASKWHKSPYELDRESKPGLLIARGTEDDKGAIATALYAMKSIHDKNITLNNTIELIVYLAEESDWGPFRTFLKTYTPPQMNVTIDASYPVVTAEKGWSNIKVDMPTIKTRYKQAYISAFSGGAFGSQIPEDATVVIENADKDLMKKLKSRALLHPQLTFSFALKQHALTVKAHGKSAHSSTPEDGVNAIAFLADILNIRQWPKTTAGLTVAYVNDLVGTGLYAELFGQIAYEDSFMGKMTLAPTVIKTSDAGMSINVNLRRPVGKTELLLKQQSNDALKQWQQKHEVKLANVELHFGEPMVVKDAPHVKPLLDIFSHYTGVKNPQPISVGGSTNAKLLPNALSFGPSMPGAEYTGHSEHEFISVKQLKLNLAMYTAMMIELGNL